MTQPQTNEELELEGAIGSYSDNPLGHVMFVYPWGEGELFGFSGPLAWQREYLEELGRECLLRDFDGVNSVDPIQMANASGHGIGKTALVAMIVHWIMDTRPGARGVITANTAPQLESKTWAELNKWVNRSLTSHWWNITTGRGSMKMQHYKDPSGWRCEGQTCREENSEAFAGLHAVSSTPFLIFDEASAIPDKIWEVAAGGLTDGEPQWHVFGNPTRNVGKFRECFGRSKHRWIRRQIDSRNVEITNKQLLQRWLEDEGEDSDFYRVRVRGVFPRASDMQFIGTDVVFEAMQREEEVLPHDPLIMGIDLARGGEDNVVCRWRRGRCARPVGPASSMGRGGVPQPIRIKGEEVRDSVKLVQRLNVAISDTAPNAIFLDGTGGYGAIGDVLRDLGHNITEIQFGAKAPDPTCANMRAYMWQEMKEWLRTGAIDDNPELEADLTGPEFGHQMKTGRLVLEAKEHMKSRGLSSPDEGDALALTFAMPTGVNLEVYGADDRGRVVHDWDPFGSF